MKKKLVILTAVIALGIVITGCNKSLTVTKVELQKATSQWQEPKVSIWYYVGTKDGYHYYLHSDLSGDQMYRVSERELIQDAAFPLTRKSENWRVMPWGVHALREPQN